MMKSFTIISLVLLVITGVSSIIHLPPKLIQSPGDASYIFGTTGNELIWVFEAEESDDHPTVFNITIDTVLQPSYTNKEWFDNTDIIVNIDGLEIGVHTVEIIVADNGVPEFAPATKDNVQVTVLESGANSSIISSSENSTFESTSSDIAPVESTSSDGVKGESSDDADTNIMSLIVTISSLLVLVSLLKRYN